MPIPGNHNALYQQLEGEQHLNKTRSQLRLLWLALNYFRKQQHNLNIYLHYLTFNLDTVQVSNVKRVLSTYPFSTRQELV